MGGIAIREARVEDIASLAGCLRHEDTIEVVAQGYKDSGDALTSAFKDSRYRFTIELNGKPVGMFGVCEMNLNTANVWLLGAPGLSKMKKYFMTMSKEVIKEMLVEYPILFAQVDQRYTKTHRWLTWLGAEVGGDYKLNGVDFNNFVFRRA